MGPNPLKRTRSVAIKNLDEELYGLVKAYASLEGRTVASVVEEALRCWVRSRGGYEEVLAWVRLERGYREDLKVLVNEVSGRYGSGYALICDGGFVGVFRSYDEAARRSREVCRGHGLIAELPYREEAEVVELGFPW